jgi:hypothetical protein
MKTAIIYNQFEEGISYHVINGDYSHLHSVYVNGDEEEKEDQLLEIIQDSEGYATKGKVSLDQFAEAISAGAKLIECGFYL